MRKFVMLLLCACSVSVTANAEAPGTMRVDYFHSGNHDTEMFSLDQVVIEPLPWTGNMAQPHDVTSRGKYLFEIVDPDTGEIAWSRSFSSIYGEWETIGESRVINRSFHESVRFPAQESVFHLVMKKRGPGNAFEEVWRIELDPADVLVHHESAMFDEHVVAIHKSGDPATKVDLLLMGDGYTAEEQDGFIAKAVELTEILFSTSPFKERKDDFNVWAIAPPAAESGVSRPSTNTFRDSPIGATYDAFRSERYVLTFDNKSMRRIASSAPYDFIEILTNSEVYGGGGIYGLYSTAAANSEWAPYLFVHEFGHHFAGHVAPNTPLPTSWPKDAFEKHSLAYQEIRQQMRADDVPEAEMNTLFRDNQDFVENLFEESGQKGVVGAFEGGNYQAEGYYRSAQNCLMFTRTEAFCAVCAEAIGKVIDEYTLTELEEEKVEEKDEEETG